MGLDFSSILGQDDPQAKKEPAKKKMFNGGNLPAKGMDAITLNAGGSGSLNINPYDLDVVKKQFEPYRIKIQGMVEKSKALVVNSAESNILAAEMGGQVSKLVKDLEDQRKAIVKKPDTFTRQTNAFVKGFRDQLISITQDLKTKVGNHSYQLEMERRKEEKAARLETARVQAILDKEAEKAGVEKVVVPEMVIPKKITPTRTAHGSSSTKMQWTYEVVDFQKVPRKHMVLNNVSITRDIQAGIRDIEGLRIFEVPKTTFRRG